MMDMDGSAAAEDMGAEAAGLTVTVSEVEVSA
eukprot:CAMPEP_0196234414 /NCGR_PEP_ID=MMETSP0913-20130531/4523_1 /TAXON_ID=49265 /ORGANISM="Thalassiosira rotula, Strain GSO102" /LENGTH=31 /DNA_ID= /DNA_START= /DNA_END= /DNA_ORIENTATION=